jgi:hypothetical protein
MLHKEPSKTITSVTVRQEPHISAFSKANSNMYLLLAKPTPEFKIFKRK